ncbi:toll/interleukin-1 receptor domain-containing protein [uncultured Paludibaculum sp.]|uniref:toll/interleukin-1 receptor domain-containing protein n=1 Tax=uncultured Paludibaculum sp. TaxID=1765020 RepID=UPI002AABDC87|nr:toll/interleukin-1 receptor domain-containing protein [uncultured Paludibaculum sp.]
MIQVRTGSIFDSKCDLLVVPCASDGDVTRSVFDNLNEHGLPVTVGAIPYGHAHFRPVNYAFASTIAYAASVNANNITAEAHAIANIARQVAEYARANQLRSVNLPLLGTGAGGMLPVDSFQALKSALAAPQDIEANIFCFTREIYQNIAAATDLAALARTLPNPRVFLSYTGTDRTNAQWVRALCDALRRNGVNARLDQYHLKPGVDLPQWMTNEVVMADKVLLICEKFYAEKSDFRKGGVGWETMIIQGDMLAQGDNKNKYIAILRGTDGITTLPVYMRSRYAFDWGGVQEIDADRLKQLILCLFDCETEPELGTIPDYVKQHRRS